MKIRSRLRTHSAREVRVNLPDLVHDQSVSVGDHLPYLDISLSPVEPVETDRGALGIGTRLHVGRSRAKRPLRFREFRPNLGDLCCISALEAGKGVATAEACWDAGVVDEVAAQPASSATTAAAMAILSVMSILLIRMCGLDEPPHGRHSVSRIP